MLLPRVTHGTPAFDTALARLCERGEADFTRAEPVAREILGDVRRSGDAGVLRWLERVENRTPRALVLRSFGGAEALARLAPQARHALEHAAARITSFHRHERETMFGRGGFHYEEEGVSLGLRVRPLSRVGVYAPGGKARYPSSVLMSAIPAKVAGVSDIVLATPLAGDASDDIVLAAAHLAGVSLVVDAGGAQAIGAMAYGTESVPRVDKIVGPGNAFVACAKRLVYGTVAIDAIAGPSETAARARPHRAGPVDDGGGRACHRAGASERPGRGSRSLPLARRACGRGLSGQLDAGGGWRLCGRAFSRASDGRGCSIRIAAGGSRLRRPHFDHPLRRRSFEETRKRDLRTRKARGARGARAGGTGPDFPGRVRGLTALDEKTSNGPNAPPGRSIQDSEIKKICPQD